MSNNTINDMQDDIDKKISIIKSKKQQIMKIKSGKKYQRLATKNRGAMEQRQYSAMNREIDKLNSDINSLKGVIDDTRIRIQNLDVYKYRPEGNNMPNPHTIKPKKEINPKDHIKIKNPAEETMLEPKEGNTNTHSVYNLNDIAFINNYTQPDSDSLDEFFS